MTTRIWTKSGTRLLLDGTTWEDDVCESIKVVLEKLFIHQSFVHCLVGTEQVVINMQVSVY